VKDRAKWVDSSVVNVVNSLLKHITQYDEGSITMETLQHEIRSDVRHSINGAYDCGFNDGLVESEDEDEYEDTQIELDLDDLRRIGEEDESA